MKNMDKGADKLTKNTPNAPKFICSNCLPKPKSFGFGGEKKLHWVSVVRALTHLDQTLMNLISKNLKTLLTLRT